MVVGDHECFPYRSSSYITRFFQRCGFPYSHDGTTCRIWACDRLTELNRGPSQAQDLPSNDLVRVIDELFEPDDFDERELSVEPALNALNKLLKKSGLVAYLDATGHCRLRNTGTGTSSSTSAQQPRPLTPDELAQRRKLAMYLRTASEDEFTDQLLVPLFQRLGFYRVTPTGHREKALEFGKDLWMKYQLPTGHWIYFCAQVKRDKIDAARDTKGNVATVLNQVRMAIEHPIFDPDANRKVLLDHVYIISADEITRSARTWLVEQLDSSQRRHVIFMDRDEFLDHSARILLDLDLGEKATVALGDNEFPF